MLPDLPRRRPQSKKLLRDSMCRKLVILGVVCLSLAVQSPVNSVSAAADSAKQESKTSPHGKAGECQACHAHPEVRLNSVLTSAEEKRKLKSDFVMVCRQCHGNDFDHGVGKAPVLNREQLPLDTAGKIVCAVTCHNMHIQAEDQVQNRYHLRLPYKRLCTSCHDK